MVVTRGQVKLFNWYKVSSTKHEIVIEIYCAVGYQQSAIPNNIVHLTRKLDLMLGILTTTR
jgi:hypothetical protein